MLTREELEKLLAQPYPRLEKRGSYAFLFQAADLILLVEPPRLPLALALQYRDLTDVQRRDLLLALAKQEHERLDARDFEELERVLHHAPSVESSSAS